MTNRAETSQRFLSPPPASARFLTLGLTEGGEPAEALHALADGTDPSVIVGLGAPLCARLGRSVPGLQPFPSDLQPLMPSTQGALWLALLHDDRGDQLDASLRLTDRLADAFAVVVETDCFTYRGGRDLSGFVDGTANPVGDEATAAAVIAGRGAGLDGGSFVAVQRWEHDLAALHSMPEAARDHVIGRRLSDDEELADAPVSAHVKRTAQEEFDPAAFVVRRARARALLRRLRREPGALHAAGPTHGGARRRHRRRALLVLPRAGGRHVLLPAGGRRTP